MYDHVCRMLVSISYTRSSYSLRGSNVPACILYATILEILFHAHAHAFPDLVGHLPGEPDHRMGLGS